MNNYEKKMQYQNGTYVIAEVGVNHNGDEDIAYRLIDVAVNAGADAVKFQMFYPELLCSSVYRQDELEMLNQYFVEIDRMKQFKEYAEGKGIDFIVTPFDFRSLQEIVDIGCDVIKIASGELTHIPFLIEAAKYDKNIILSTGASYLSDVERAVLEIKKTIKKDLALLHCTSTYPAPNDGLNLQAIKTLKAAFPDCTIGYSDHSLGNVAASIAITLGARIVEKHITLDKKLEGPDHRASSDSFEFIEMVKIIRETDIMLGDGRKMPQKCEAIIGRSIVAKRDMEIGEVITEKDLDYKRPGYGVRPYEINKFIGSRLQNKVLCDEILKFDDIIERDND